MILATIPGRKEIKQRFRLADLDSAFVIEQKRVNSRLSDWRTTDDAISAPTEMIKASENER
jgi:hypothetical protein